MPLRVNICICILFLALREDISKNDYGFVVAIFIILLGLIFLAVVGAVVYAVARSRRQSRLAYITPKNSVEDLAQTRM